MAHTPETKSLTARSKELLSHRSAAALLAVLALTACGEAKAQPESQPSPTVATSEAPEPTPIETTEETSTDSWETYEQEGRYKEDFDTFLSMTPEDLLSLTTQERVVLGASFEATGSFEGFSAYIHVQGNDKYGTFPDGETLAEYGPFSFNHPQTPDSSAEEIYRGHLADQMSTYGASVDLQDSKNQKLDKTLAVKLNRTILAPFNNEATEFFEDGISSMSETGALPNKELEEFKVRDAGSSVNKDGLITKDLIVTLDTLSDGSKDNLVMRFAFVPLDESALGENAILPDDQGKWVLEAINPQEED